MCFCINNNCTKRKNCKRALENHNPPKEQMFSMAHFDCEKGEYDFFIKYSV